MSKTTALLTGSMNPFTRGHKHLVDTCLLIFDSVVVALGSNPEKEGQVNIFTQEQRERMVTECLLEHGERVTVTFFTGATVDFAAEIRATAIIRGLRDETDQDYEASMSHANHLISTLEHGRHIPTIYFPCPPALTEISSSRVRELIGLRRSTGVLSEYVMPVVANIIAQEIYTKT